MVVEKEPAPALHQSGRNRIVRHSGIYHRPGSLKARTCRAGAASMLNCTGPGCPFLGVHLTRGIDGR